MTNRPKNQMRAKDAVAPRVFFAGPLLDRQYVVYDGDGRPEMLRVSTAGNRYIKSDLENHGTKVVVGAYRLSYRRHVLSEMRDLSYASEKIIATHSKIRLWQLIRL